MRYRFGGSGRRSSGPARSSRPGPGARSSGPARSSGAARSSEESSVPFAGAAPFRWAGEFSRGTGAMPSGPVSTSPGPGSTSPDRSTSPGPGSTSPGLMSTPPWRWAFRHSCSHCHRHAIHQNPRMSHPSCRWNGALGVRSSRESLPSRKLPSICFTCPTDGGDRCDVLDYLKWQSSSSGYRNSTPPRGQRQLPIMLVWFQVNMTQMTSPGRRLPVAPARPTGADRPFVLPRPEIGAVAVEPPGQGSGYWAGGPSAVFADGEISPRLPATAAARPWPWVCGRGGPFGGRRALRAADHDPQGGHGRRFPGAPLPGADPRGDLAAVRELRDAGHEALAGRGHRGRPPGPVRLPPQSGGAAGRLEKGRQGPGDRPPRRRMADVGHLPSPGRPRRG